jgi:prophage antirepressor-like protein
MVLKVWRKGGAMTEEEIQKHRQAMLDHLMRRQELLLALSKLLDRLDRHNFSIRSFRKTEGETLLIEATDMLHRIVEEVMGDATN